MREEELLEAHPERLAGLEVHVGRHCDGDGEHREEDREQRAPDELVRHERRLQELVQQPAHQLVMVHLAQAVHLLAEQLRHADPHITVPAREKAVLARRLTP